MTSVAVYVLLLDNLTALVSGFNNALNDTIVRTVPPFNAPTIEKCNPVTTDLIINAIKQKINYEVMPNYINEEVYRFSKENLAEELINNSIPEEENLIDAPHDNRLDFPENFYNKYIRYENKPNVTFPKSAPFVVAIFETLSNITAQTCAGTLVHPSWVLTSTSCVNVLSSLMVNITDTSTSEYTVIANATNPLLDGSVHTVTSIHLPPGLISPTWRGYTGPYVTLMKIEPEAKETIRMVEERVVSGNVMIYGWALNKNISGQDEMRLESMSALIMSDAECRAMYKYKNDTLICLFNKDFGKNIMELSTGGPVVMLQQNEVKMLAVVHAEDNLFLAHPVSKLHTWIAAIIANK